MTAKEYEQRIMSVSAKGYGKIFSIADAMIFLMQIEIAGEPIPSVRLLAARFGWSKSKVSEFLCGQKTDNNSDKKRTLCSMKNNALQKCGGQKMDSDSDKKRTDTRLRAHAFGQSLVAYIPEYGKDMIRKFYDYWTECNKSGTKMRFEKEKTWDTSRRLRRWAESEKQYGTNKPNTTDKITMQTAELIDKYS